MILQNDHSVEPTQAEKDELKKLEKELFSLKSQNSKRFEMSIADSFQF
jgi:hypothetical protein